MAEGVLAKLLDIEKAVLDAAGEVAGAASDAVVATLNGAAAAVREVIDTIGGGEG